MLNKLIFGGPVKDLLYNGGFEDAKLFLFPLNEFCKTTLSSYFLLVSQVKKNQPHRIIHTNGVFKGIWQ